MEEIKPHVKIQVKIRFVPGLHTFNSLNIILVFNNSQVQLTALNMEKKPKKKEEIFPPDFSSLTLSKKILFF